MQLHPGPCWRINTSLPYTCWIQGRTLVKPHSGSQLAVPDGGTWQPWGHGPIPTSCWGLWCSRNSRLFFVDCKPKFRSLGLISCLCRGSRNAGGPKDLCWSYGPESSCLEKMQLRKRGRKWKEECFFLFQFGPTSSPPPSSFFLNVISRESEKHGFDSTLFYITNLLFQLMWYVITNKLKYINAWQNIILLARNILQIRIYF